MKLKTKLLLISIIPIMGMITIFLLESNLYKETISSMEHINYLQKDLRAIQSGDRDAYQAHLAMFNAYQSIDLEFIKKELESFEQKSKLVKEKVSATSSHFSEEMKKQHKLFEQSYDKWISYNKLMFEKLSSVATLNEKVMVLSLDSEKDFLKTRKTIDSLAKRIEQDLKRRLSTRRRIALEKALMAVLRSDREAYQAYAAQRLSLSEKNINRFQELDQFNQKSAENVPKLFNQAVKLYGAKRLVQTQQAFNENFDKWSSVSREVFNLAVTLYKDNKSKAAVLPLINSSFEAVRESIETISALETSRSDAEVDTSKANGVFMSMVVLAISLTLVLVTLFMGVIFSRSIVKQVGGEPAKIAGYAKQVAAGEFTIEHSEKNSVGILAVLFDMAGSLQTAVNSIQETMSRVSQGDFSARMDDESLKGDLAIIGDSINDSVRMLSDAIYQVLVVTDQVSEGAGQLAGSAQALASGTTQQAASLEQIGSAMSEIGNRAQTSNANADQAAQLSRQALDVANRGNLQMKEMLGSMDKISGASNDISKIIKVIDEIAFQTNLLALNAAVEAARAGKYGKGFSVVAEEVRNLAGRSAEAARDTTALIENSLKEVGNGVDNAAKTAEILDEISGGVSKVNDLVVEIAAASLEQKTAAEEMNNAITQVNNVVQQNSSISEQTASTSDELKSQAAQLKEMMSSFILLQADKIINKAEQEALQQPAGVSPELLEQEKVLPKLPLESKKQSQKMITLDDESFGKY